MQLPSTDILIREANSADAADVTAVLEAAFTPLRAIYRPTADTLTRQTKHRWKETRLVAELAGHVVATVQYDQHETHLHVLGLAVHPDFQRKGIAGSLLDRIVADASQLGLQTVVMETIRETGNVPVFEKLGFHIVQENIAVWCVSETHEQLYFVTMKRTVV